MKKVFIISFLVALIMTFFGGCKKECFDGYLIVEKSTYSHSRAQDSTSFYVYTVRSYYKPNYQGNYEEFDIQSTDGAYNVGDKLSLVKIKDTEK